MSVDAFSCVILRVRRCDGFDGVWAPGPLPVEIPVDQAQGRSGGASVADATARSRYFAARIADTLYASSLEDRTGRWHLPVTGSPSQSGFRIVAWECLLEADRQGEVSGYAVAHTQLSANPVEDLAGLSRRTGEGRRWLESSLPAGLEPIEDSGLDLVSHLMFAGRVLPEPDDRAMVLDQTLSWSTTDRWLWFLASGVDADSYLPDPASPRPGSTVFLSSDWRALALRNGVSYCALTPVDRGPHELLRAFVRSIHLDGFLLCLRQTDAAGLLADQMGQTRVETLTVDSAMEMEEQLLALRGDLWWRHVSGRGNQVEAVVRAVQDERDLPELYQQLVAELTDTGRFIQLRQARADQERERKLSQLVSVVSAAFVTPSVFLAAVALVPNPSRTLQIAFWGSAVVLAGFTWFGMRAWLGRTERR